MNIPLCVSERLCLERDNCVRRYNQLVLKNHFFCMLLRIGMKPIFVMGWGLGEQTQKLMLSTRKNLKSRDIRY